MASAAAAPRSSIIDVPLRSTGVAGAPTVKVVTLPKGTILFRAIYLRSPAEDPRGQDLFQDLLGFPVGDNFCLSPTHGVYCFAIPYVGFGLFDWTSRSEAWRKYNAFMVYALTEDTRFVILIRPAAEVRGTPKGWGIGDLIVRCDKFPPTVCYRGRANEAARQAAFKKAQEWDNCLDPVRRGEENIGGWIAVAEGDSIDIVDRKKGRTRPRLTPMGAYLSSMRPGDLADTLPHMVVDARGTRGFPEIVVSPWRAAAGLRETLFRPTTSFVESIRMVTADLAAGHLAIAPIATVTAAGFYFYDGPGEVGFRREGLGSGNRPRNMDAEARRYRIEQNSFELMTRLGRGQVDGLPAVTFNRRTGFFVIGGAGLDGHMGLRTGAEWDAVRRYCVKVKGGVASSEYLFQRPASIGSVLRDLEISFEGNSGLARLARDLVGMEVGAGTAAAGTSARVVGGTGQTLQLLLPQTQTRKNYLGTSKVLGNKTMRNNNKRNRNKTASVASSGSGSGSPNPEIISMEVGRNLGELYSGLGAAVKAIFV